jgi:hypothetical protein
MACTSHSYLYRNALRCCDVDLGQQQVQLGGGDAGADIGVLQGAHHLYHPAQWEVTQHGRVSGTEDNES